MTEPKNSRSRLLNMAMSINEMPTADRFCTLISEQYKTYLDAKRECVHANKYGSRKQRDEKRRIYQEVVKRLHMVYEDYHNRTLRSNLDFDLAGIVGKNDSETVGPGNPDFSDISSKFSRDLDPTDRPERIARMEQEDEVDLEDGK